MSKPFDVRDQLATFAGTAPLFPLPDVVHFPHLLLPLHIFEPRYREMVADAIEGDRLLAMALLKPGSTTTAGSPPIHNTVCLGRITANQQTEDGRYYLVLQGLSRAQDHSRRERRPGLSRGPARAPARSRMPLLSRHGQRPPAAAVVGIPQPVSQTQPRPCAPPGPQGSGAVGHFVRRAGRCHVARLANGLPSARRDRRERALPPRAAVDPGRARTKDRRTTPRPSNVAHRWGRYPRRLAATVQSELIRLNRSILN